MSLLEDEAERVRVPGFAVPLLRNLERARRPLDPWMALHGPLTLRGRTWGRGAA
ncbi:MAG: hypothetical protein JRH16_22710 [Deltaproteobacteria bacterium]|nr:hypothetical protein [Deltaproteobacteria bacterium]MBW2361587.1 hypothetical protein [Deltaproteobacteria bacterium]